MMFKKNNIIDNRKFDEFVRESLVNYEVISALPDWQKMQDMLSIAPKVQSAQAASSDSFSLSLLKKRTVSYSALVVLMLAVVGYLIYALVKPSGNKENAIIESIDSLQNTSQLITSPIVDSIEEEAATVALPKDTVASEIKMETKKEDVAEEKKEEEEKKDVVETKEKKEAKKEIKKEPETVKATDKKKEPKKEEPKKEEPKKNNKKERDKKVETEGAVKKKEDQLKKSDNAIGLSNLLLLPVDNQEQQAPPKQNNDSTKAP